MIRGLLEKELRQHGIALLFVLLLLVAGVGVILQNKFLHTSFGTTFAGVRFLLLTFMPLACLVLGQALVVSEYRHKTQLFLEGLPLPRWRMIALKYGMGLLLLLVAVVVVLITAWSQSLAADVVTPRFLWLLGLRSLCYVWFLWSLFFAHGFMGRYRVVFGILALFVIRVDINIPPIDFGLIGPFELIGDRFAYERFEVPGIQLIVTAFYAVFWTSFGLILGLARDATIGAALAQRMNAREKIILTIVLFAGILMMAEYKDQRKAPAPVLLPGAVEVIRGNVQVTVASAVNQPTEEENAVLEAIARRVSDELCAVSVFLRCEKMPPVFIVHRRDLKPGILKEGDILQEQGLMVRANLTAKEFDRDALLRWVVRGTLARRSFGRLSLERNAWVFRGFTNWWFGRFSSMDQNPKELQDALLAMPPDFSVRDLDRWLTLYKKNGDAKACALASTGLHVLASKYGEEATRNFLASVLGVEVKKGSMAWFRDVFNPVSSRFRKATGVTLDRFVAEWRDALLENKAKVGGAVKP